jgi:hypothetical protein
MAQSLQSPGSARPAARRLGQSRCKDVSFVFDRARRRMHLEHELVGVREPDRARDARLQIDVQLVALPLQLSVQRFPHRE